MRFGAYYPKHEKKKKVRVVRWPADGRRTLARAALAPNEFTKAKFGQRKKKESPVFFFRRAEFRVRPPAPLFVPL